MPNEEREQAQHEKLKALAEATGLTPEELKVLAKERGVTPEELSLEEMKALAEAAGRTPPGGVTPPPGDPADPPVEPGEEAAPAPGDADGGIPGLGVPYEDFIPTFPMVKDPTTGQWRNAEPGEIPGPAEGGDEGPPPVLDPNAQPMPMPSPDQPTGLDPDAKPMPMPSPEPHEPVPYEDYIPFFPMVKDPATGEWRNAEAGEIPGLGEDQLPPGTQTPEAEPPVQPTPPGDDAGGGALGA